MDVRSLAPMSRKFVISLVRHGETLSNRQKIMQGQTNTQLSDVGFKQAQLLATRLAFEKFTHMFSSDLARASDTAQTILKANKSFTGQLVLDRRLRERAFGNLEGKPLSAHRLAAQEAHIPTHIYTPDGGETVEQVTVRATAFFDDLCALMADPLIHNAEIFCEDLKNGVSTSGQSFDRSHDACGVDNTGADPLEPLHIDIPECFRFSEPQSDGCIEDSRRHSGPSKFQDASHLDSSSSQPLSLSSNSSPLNSVLIVSHGLLLRELKRLILDRYDGQLLATNVKDAGTVCPNTGLSQFTMCVSINDNKVCAKCQQVHFISDISHLITSSDDLASHSQFKGAL